jgi:hypothetical protein
MDILLALIKQSIQYYKSKADKKSNFFKILILIFGTISHYLKSLILIKLYFLLTVLM